MTEQQLIVVHNYLKERRDAYGFALRPQHVQRYQEYVCIYTEEETERAERWKIFLDRKEVSAAEPCSSEEEFQDTFQADGNDSEEKSASQEGSRNSETFNELSKEEEPAVEPHVLEENQYLREKSLRRDSEPVKDEEEKFESVKEKESSLDSESDEEKQSQSVKEPVKDEEDKSESEKKKEKSVDSESESDEEKQSQSVKESVKDEKEKSESDKEKESSVDSQSESDEEKQSQSVKEPVKDEEEKFEYDKEKSVDNESESDEEKQSQSVKEPVKDEEEKFESEKEKSVYSESESDGKKQSQSVKEPVDHVHNQQEKNATENLLAEETDKCGLEHEKGQNETKARRVIEWAHIRPCLASIEAMMCSRVKKVKYMKNRHNTLIGDHASSINQSLPSIRESEHNSGGNDENDADGSVSPKPFFPWYEELEVLVRLGVPKDLRGEVWQAFVGVKARRVERYYQDLLAQITDSDETNEQPNSSDVQRKWKKQIEKDIPRTFPGHPALNEAGRDSLRRILLAYACHNPSVGYCQAMNFFAGLLLLLMPEENAFWTLVGIIDDYFGGYYTEEMIESQVDQLVFEELMRERFPKLVNHLDYLGVQVAWISGPWFLSIFVNILPWECVLRMWDVLLFEGNRVVLFRTAFALMELYGPSIVATKDAGDAITSLQSLASSTFDSSQLILTACMGYLSTNEARLEELRERHRPAVLEIVEERIQKGRVWKDKKGLASKLYSFKHEGSILDEQKSCENPDADESPSPNVDGANVDSELDSLPDLQEQAVWLKVELCRLLEEKRSAVLRAEELEIALMEMVKEDNRLELSALVEQLEKEVKELKQILSDKKEQETAMLQVLMKVEQDQKLTEDARVSAEQDAAAQRYAVHVLEEKNEKLVTQLAQMEKRLVTAETTLEATLQYESGQNKALSSPRFARTVQDTKKKTGFLSFGLGWRDRNKAKQPEESNSDNTSNATSPSKESVSGKGSNLSKENKSEDLLNPETRR